MKTGEPLFTIVDLSQLWLYLDAYESDLPWLHLRGALLFDHTLIKKYDMAGDFSGKFHLVGNYHHRSSLSCQIGNDF